MRSIVGLLVLAAVLGCGSGRSADGGSTQQGGQKFTLSIAMAGSGKGSVRLADGTVACPGTCSAVGVAGSPIRLEAVADAGSHFLGWSGACSGSASCEVSLARDSSVTATFDKSAGKPRLIVAINGSGGVKSDPAGIDCGATCVAQFDSGTLVRLIPTAAQGFAFVGWGGGCSGAAPCGVAIDGDVQVWATFAPVEPADECDGFMPASVPAPVDAVIAGETCVRGLSDDRDGNYLLNTFKSGNVGGDTFHFFQVRNGSARDTGNTQLGPAMGGTSLYSQPSGFDAVDVIGGGFYSVRVFSSDGQQGAVVPNLSHPGDLVLVANDPTGGLALLRTETKSDGTRSVTYTRIDKNGTKAADAVPVDLAGRYAVALGSDLADNVLVLTVNGGQGPGTHPLFARWLSSMGAPATDWFDAGDTFVKNPDLVVVYEGLALRDSGGGFVKLFRDAQPTVESAPGWMNAGRGANQFALVRGGKGYASWSGGPCGDGLEILAKSGKSCGCIADTRMGAVGTSNRNSVERDGSAIVMETKLGGSPDQSQCTFHIWPQLLR